MSNENPTCYARSGDVFNVTYYMSPCGPINDTDGVVPCCKPGDVCYSNNFCHTNTSDIDSSSWYIGGCTDADYTSPVCSSTCQAKSLIYSAAIYNETDLLWECCGATQIDGQNVASCNNPTNQTFEAPPDWDLISYYPVPMTGPSTPLAEWPKAKSVSLSTSVAATASLTSSRTSSRISSLTFPNIASGPPSSQKANQLSSEARVGIGVGVSLVVLIFCGMAAAICFLMRRARNVVQPGRATEVFEEKDSSDIMGGNSRRKDLPSKQESVAELAGATQHKYELPPQCRQELSAQDRQELSAENVFDRHNAIFPVAAYQL